MEFWENGACSLFTGKFFKLIWSQKSYRIFQLGFYGKKKKVRLMTIYQAFLFVLQRENPLFFENRSKISAAKRLIALLLIY